MTIQCQDSLKNFWKTLDSGGSSRLRCIIFGTFLSLAKIRMAGVNKVILVGNLGADPEIRTLESGAKVATISIATTEFYKDRNGERQSQTEWHRVVLWRGLAGVAEDFLKKGSQVYVEGKLRTRSYDDQNGVKRYVTEIEARDLNMLGKRDEEYTSPNQPLENPNPSQPNQEEDDLPF
jgi:single-strand DNA-binding protein